MDQAVSLSGHVKHQLSFPLFPVLWDKRYSIVRFSQSEFSISISNVAFKDGGNYTCCQYTQEPVEKTVELTVLGKTHSTTFWLTPQQPWIIMKCMAPCSTEHMSAHVQLRWHHICCLHVAPPRMSVTKHEGKHVVKCRAQGNHHPPHISWEFDHQPEFMGKFYKV